MRATRWCAWTRRSVGGVMRRPRRCVQAKVRTCVVQRRRAPCERRAGSAARAHASTPDAPARQARW